MIGVTLDKYEVLQKVGEGGMATVYRGRHCTLDREVAIKILHPHLSSSTRNRKRFAREARAIEHLRHDNILEIFDYSGVDTSDCYIITEFVEGDTLTELLRARTSLPSEVVAIIGLRLAGALAYAHREGILHRDLKPENIMLRQDGTVKLMDFGIARFLDESQVTMTGALVGSPAFMSPEQAREANLDHRSDLFSLGTTLFYLVTGSLPFTGSNPSLILKNVIEANRPSVSELSAEIHPGLADVIERLMATSPEDRFSHSDDVAAALRAVLAESNVDPQEERWSLGSYLQDADAYEEALTAHLCQMLVLRGKERLGQGDHLAALRLFNRLLALDEDNEEVLELVQGLHGAPQTHVRPSTMLIAALLLFVLGGAAYAWVWTGKAARQAEAGAAPLAQPTTNPAPAAGTAEVEPVPSTEPQPQPEPRDREPQVGTTAPVPTTRSTPVTTPPEQPAEPEGIAEEAEWGRLRIQVNNELFGTIWVDGQNMAGTRKGEWLQLAPGGHDVEIRGQHIQTWKQQVDISPGEEQTVQVELEAKPSALAFPESWAGTCTVFLDDSEMGTLAELAYSIDVPKPNLRHTVRVACPDGAEKTESWDHVRPYTRFPDPEAP